jgi:hypothetical protein
MNSRLDQLFSPDRLRQNWQNLDLPATLAPTQNSTDLSIYQQYLKLQQILNQNFSDLSPLSVQLATLAERMEIVFGADAVVPAEAEQKNEIVGLLEELEELLWALELSEQGKP